MVGGGRRRIDIEQLLNSEAEGEKVPWTQEDEYGRSMDTKSPHNETDAELPKRSVQGPQPGGRSSTWDMVKEQPSAKVKMTSSLKAATGDSTHYMQMLLAPASSRHAHVQPNPKRKRPDGHNGKRTTETHRHMCPVCENPVETRAVTKASPNKGRKFYVCVHCPPSKRLWLGWVGEPELVYRRCDFCGLVGNYQSQCSNGCDWRSQYRPRFAYSGSPSAPVFPKLTGVQCSGGSSSDWHGNPAPAVTSSRAPPVTSVAVLCQGVPADPVVALDKNTAGSNNSSLPDLLASQQNMPAPNARKRKEPFAADGSAARREMEKQREPHPPLPLSSPLERETTQSPRKGGWEGAEKHHCLTGAVVATPAPRAVHRNSSVVSNASSKPFNTATAATAALQDVPDLKVMKKEGYPQALAHSTLLPQMKLCDFLITWLHGFERRPTLRCPLAKKWQRHEDKSLRHGQLVSPDAKLKQVLNTFLALLAYAHTCTPNGLAPDADKNPIHARTGDSGILFLGLKVLVPSHGRLDIREASGNVVAYIEHISDVRFVLRNGKESIAVIRNLQTTKNKLPAQAADPSQNAWRCFRLRVLASQLLGPETLRQWDSTYSVYTKHQHGAPLEPAYVISPDQCKGLLSSCELSAQPVEVIQRSSPSSAVSAASSAVSAASSGADSLGGFRIVLTVPDSVLPQSLQAPPAGIPPRPEARGCAQQPPVADACKGTGVAIAATPSLTANSTVSSQQQPPSAPGFPAELPSEVMELDCRDCRDLQLTKKERTALEAFSKWLHRKGWCLSGAVENPFEAVALLLNALGIEGGGHTEKSLRKGCEDIFGRLPADEQRKMAKGTGFEPAEYRALVGQTLQEFQLRQKQWEQRKDDRINMPREPAGWDANVAELVCRRFHVSIHTHKPRKRDLDTGGSRTGQGGHHLRYLTMER
eukprot:g43422.t1